jgi:hypothetical protein
MHLMISFVDWDNTCGKHLHAFFIYWHQSLSTALLLASVSFGFTFLDSIWDSPTCRGQLHGHQSSAQTTGNRHF